MELEVQHENQTIILWLRSGCRTDLSLLYEMPHILTTEKKYLPIIGKNGKKTMRRFDSMISVKRQRR